MNRLLVAAAGMLALASPACFADPVQSSSPAIPASSEPVAGAMLEERKQLWAKIQDARDKGVGIGGYLTAFQALEEQVKSGDTADKIAPRVQSISRGLDDQLRRAEVLKTQRPLPPQGSQVSGSSPSASLPSGPRGGKAAGGAVPEDAAAKFGPLLEKLKGSNPNATLEDIPEDKIPEGLRAKLKDPAVRRKLQEKFGL